MRITAVLLTSVALTTAANAADLIIEQPVLAPAPAASWDGAYFGIHLGGAGGTETDNQSIFFGDEEEEEEEGGGQVAADSFSLSGWLLGLHGGVNLQSGSFVFGVEGIVDATNLSGSAEYDYGGDDTGILSFASDWQASLNVRGGLAVDALLFYGSLGVAIADGTLTDDTDFDGLYEDSNTHVGWTVAAGLEYLFDENWSGRIEARYSDFGDADYDLGFDDGDVTASFTQTALTAGLSYHF